MSPTLRFSSVLVANRGEIARRVFRSATAKGLRTIAVYSEADRGARHVREADEAVLIGPAPVTESYLSIAAILEAARTTGAEAIHPGYGFLSENATFATACAEAGIVFIGPPPGAIEAMSRKDGARRIAVAAGVPVAPAAQSDDPLELAELVRADIGFPCLIKAVAGGGGKGMRIVRSKEALGAALEAARNEARASFGDGSVFVERLIEGGRHIEVQVFADEHGNVVHLFDRDCSVQRRHQKVIEEAPATSVSEAVRGVIGQAAVRLSAEIGYVSAGTVEFLVSGEEAFFLEMNTRLQVEHPVTELVTGLDLVSLQLDVAQGLALPFAQDAVVASGHTIEARVYAEDPDSGFLPQAGFAEAVHWPVAARVDEALESGQTVSTDYDPMLGKIVTWGATRAVARERLVRALDDTAIFGLQTNSSFLRRLVASPAFANNEIDTGSLDRGVPVLDPPDATTARRVAAILLSNGREHARGGPFANDGWRLAGPRAPVHLSIEGGGARSELVVEPDGTVRDELGETQIAIEEAQPEPSGSERIRVRVGANDVIVHALATPHDLAIAHEGATWRFRRPDRLAHDRGTLLLGGDVVAPLPGTVLSITFGIGATVIAGDVLGVIESMKMQLPLVAPLDGVLERVDVAPGDHVALGALMFSVVSPEKDPPEEA